MNEPKLTISTYLFIMETYQFSQTYTIKKHNELFPSVINVSFSFVLYHLFSYLFYFIL